IWKEQEERFLDAGPTKTVGPPLGMTVLSDATIAGDRQIAGRQQTQAELRISIFHFRSNGVVHDSHKTKNHAGCRTGRRPFRWKRRRMARSKPQQQAPPLGTPQSPQSQTDSNRCRGAGAPANSRATPGTAARPPERNPPGTRPSGHSHPRAAGRGTTSDTTGSVAVARAYFPAGYFLYACPCEVGSPFLDHTGRGAVRVGFVRARRCNSP